MYVCMYIYIWLYIYVCCIDLTVSLLNILNHTHESFRLCISVSHEPLNRCHQRSAPLKSWRVLIKNCKHNRNACQNHLRWQLVEHLSTFRVAFHKLSTTLQLWTDQLELWTGKEPQWTWTSTGNESIHTKNTNVFCPTVAIARFEFGARQ